MTKWICKMCSHTCIIWMGGEYHSCPSRCIYVSPQADISKWERVDEPETPLADATFNREDWVWLEYARKRDLCHSHEANLLEMAGNLQALKERVEALEKSQHAGPYAAALDHLNLREAVKRLEQRLRAEETVYRSNVSRLTRLEHQMRNHYHHTGVWCETEDGSGTERLVK